MSDYAEDAAKRAKSLRAKNEEMKKLPIGGKPAKMGETYMYGPEGISGRNGIYNEKAASEAYDHTMNIRESEAEDQEVRAKKGKDAGELGKSWSKTFK